MLFNSYAYILIFHPVVIVIYFYLNRLKLVIAAKSFLIFSSLLFYSYWNPAYLGIFIGSIIFNYAIGTSLLKGDPTLVRQKTLFAVGVVANLLLLFYFKYIDFAIDNINIALNLNIEHFRQELPLGISFFTFTQLAYLFDCHTSSAKEQNLLNYTLFVSFYPHLIAGPIIHHYELMPQFSRLKNNIFQWKNFNRGLYIFAIGLFKKAVIADSLSTYATNGFDIATTVDFFEAWTTSLSYSLQLYFDFSAYSDMAIGSALMFNIDLPINFNSPYKAVNIQDFWRRWHITLSKFLRDYVYIPLGGNKRGELRTYVNLFTTFFLAGIWHGAGWTFIVWGCMHGLATIAHRAWTRLGLRMPGLLGWFVTMMFINFSWVFFRAKSFVDALKILKGMCGLEGFKLPSAFARIPLQLDPEMFQYGKFLKDIDGNMMTVAFLVISLAIALFARNSIQLGAAFALRYRSMAWTALLGAAGLLFINRASEFLYFQF